METNKAIEKNLKDIRSIVSLLDPPGYVWAQESKACRMGYKIVHPDSFEQMGAFISFCDENGIRIEYEPHVLLVLVIDTKGLDTEIDNFSTYLECEAIDPGVLIDAAEYQYGRDR